MLCADIEFVASVGTDSSVPGTNSTSSY